MVWKKCLCIFAWGRNTFESVWEIFSTSLSDLYNFKMSNNRKLLQSSSLPLCIWNRKATTDSNTFINGDYTVGGQVNGKNYYVQNNPIVDEDDCFSTPVTPEFIYIFYATGGLNQWVIAKALNDLTQGIYKNKTTSNDLIF